jgi:4-hydroxy-3-methylbut-2-en-1-yl diphosphate reductase
MTIQLAEHSGFCFGVRRSIQMALDAAQAGNSVCTLGELIHNPQIVKDLENKGIRSCDLTDAASADTVVIRSHGIRKDDLESLVASGKVIVDATCPFVKKAQEIVAEMSAFPVMIMGDKEHPEVAGMLSYGNDQTIVVNPDTDFGCQRWKTLCVVSQTTQKINDLQILVTRLLPRVSELRVFNTICSATVQHQADAVALAKVSDLMIVIGGKKSANTRKLQELCSTETRSIHIETEDEIDPQLVLSARRVGLTAGASTPEETIVKVFNTIKKINGEADIACDINDLPLFKEESC